MTTILHLIDPNCQHLLERSHGVMLSGAKGRVDRFECQKGALHLEHRNNLCYDQISRGIQ